MNFTIEPPSLCEKITELQSFTKDEFKYPDEYNDTEKAELDMYAKWLNAPVDPEVKIPPAKETINKPPN
jgi:hypothetical protein